MDLVVMKLYVHMLNFQPRCCIIIIPPVFPLWPLVVAVMEVSYFNAIIYLYLWVKYTNKPSFPLCVTTTVEVSRWTSQVSWRPLETLLMLRSAVWNIPSCLQISALWKQLNHVQWFSPLDFQNTANAVVLTVSQWSAGWSVEGIDRLLLISNSRNSPFWKLCLMTLTSS